MRGEVSGTPWAGHYWPAFRDSINDRWAGGSTESPAAKYARAFGLDPKEVEDAVSRAHGIDRHTGARRCTDSTECDESLGEVCGKRGGAAYGRCIPTWVGMCHAWAPAAILEPEPMRSVWLAGVEFKVQDIKALVTLVYDSTRARGVALRCELEPGLREAFDRYGRPVREECRDTNAGTYHLLMTNYLGIRGESFVEDRVRGFEVWNQPMRGYTITKKVEVSAEEANRLVGTEEGAFTYRFNEQARQVVHVALEARYIGESPASQDGNLRAQIDRYTGTDRYEYVLELDDSGRILGGEWVGDSKRNHPDFLWLPLSRTGTAAEDLITYQNVRRLVDAAR